MSRNILSKINDTFKINYENGLYTLKDIKTADFLPQRMIRSLDVIEPNFIFIFNYKPIILFFDKNKNKDEMFKQCWNFAESPIVIIESESDFEIYNGFDYIIKDKSLRKLSNSENEINYISLISGKYLENSKDIFENKKTKLDTNLLKNIKNAREKILQSNISQHIANSLIGRIIFIRYLIDRNVKFNFNKIFNTQDIEIKKEELKRILSSREETYNLFRYLKSEDGFNGDWFPIDEEKESIVSEKHLEILKNLISGYDFNKKQSSLFDVYDFSIIPIEFISNVYESFIGEENQKKDGAYYTPTFLVDYILKYTVDKYFKNNPNEYNCKVLDPACGSGIFLVETFRKLVAQYEKIKGDSISPEKIIELVKDNIYAIDKNEEALSISVFSLYLVMLDYQNPKDIEKFKFPYLLDSDDNKDTPNFFNDDFFDTDALYGNILKNKEIDFIIGNPPYGESTIKKDYPADKYVKANKINVGNKDIVQAFMIKVKDIVSENTKISFIVTSKVLYNLDSEDFRKKHFFNQFKVNHILELSSVRKEVFDGAKVPVAMIFYEYSNETEISKNEINYISMKPNPYFKKLKILMLSKNDFKKVLQLKLIENDYLWKILVYGSYLDFNLINKLKSNEYQTIQNLVDTGELIKYQGFKRKDGNKKIDTTQLKGFRFIDTSPKKKNLKPFYITKTLDKFNYDSVGYSKKLNDNYIDSYKAPLLLFTGGLTNELKQNSAISYENVTFPSSAVVLKPIKTTVAILRNINGLFYSKFFSYFLLHTGSSTGIKQEESDDHETLSLPFIKNKNISLLVSEIESLKKEHFDTNNSNIFNYEKDLDSLINKLDDRVLKSLNLNEQEYAIMDYANDIIIPWVMQKKYEVAFRPYEYNNKEDRKKIEEYVNITIEENQELYKEMGKFFQATVLWDRYTIGVYYKVLNKQSIKPIIWKEESNINNFLKFSNGQPLENLFIQKDIKGFESDGYYVIKPNEYKNWHKAIGYLDFYEFEKAILNAGRGAQSV